MIPEKKFYVDYDGSQYYINSLNNSGLPYEVLLYAYEQFKDGTRTAPITSDELNNNTKTHVGKKSLKSRVYDNRGAVRQILSPFVKLKEHEMFLVMKASLTPIILRKLMAEQKS